MENLSFRRKREREIFTNSLSAKSVNIFHVHIDALKIQAIGTFDVPVGQIDLIRVTRQLSLLDSDGGDSFLEGRTGQD